jgi:hypothetical protein
MARSTSPTSLGKNSPLTGRERSFALAGASSDRHAAQRGGAPRDGAPNAPPSEGQGEKKLTRIRGLAAARPVWGWTPGCGRCYLQDVVSDEPVGRSQGERYECIGTRPGSRSFTITGALRPEFLVDRLTSPLNAAIFVWPSASKVRSFPRLLSVTAANDWMARAIQWRSSRASAMEPHSNTRARRSVRHAAHYATNEQQGSELGVALLTRYRPKMSPEMTRADVAHAWGERKCSRHLTSLIDRARSGRAATTSHRAALCTTCGQLLSSCRFVRICA